jgi:uncharacterized protein (DUF2141 family)
VKARVNNQGASTIPLFPSSRFVPELSENNFPLIVIEAQTFDFTENCLMTRFLIAAIAPLFCCAIAQAASANDLKVSIAGLKNQRGQICLSVFANGQGFPNNGNAAIRAQCTKASNPSITFKNLKPGNYAIAIVHDANSNNRLDTNPLGIPTEGFGFSRDPQILTGPPKFGDSAFNVQGSTQIRINLRYLFG